MAPQGDEAAPAQGEGDHAPSAPEPAEAPVSAQEAPEPSPPQTRAHDPDEGLLAAGCRASPASGEGFASSRSISYARERNVTTNATSLSAILALAGPLAEPLRPEDATSLLERADEVCLFTPSAWREGDAEALLVRFLTVHERRVSLGRELVIHLLALGGNGSGFPVRDVLDVHETTRTLRLVEMRVPPASDETLLRLALDASVPDPTREEPPPA